MPIGCLTSTLSRTALSACAPLALAACATPTSFAGVSLIPGEADSELQSLASSAQAGDKHALLELGIRYENGDGVPVDLDRAKALYRESGATTGGVIWVYVPPVGEAPGQVIPLDVGPKQNGLWEAYRRLDLLLDSQVDDQAKSVGGRR